MICNCIKFVLQKKLQFFNSSTITRTYYKFWKKQRIKLFSYDQLKENLLECKSMDDQTGKFFLNYKLKEYSVQLRLSVCQDIHNILKQKFPESSLHILGSSATGLGLEGCDLDLTFQPFSYDEERCVAGVINTIGRNPSKLAPIIAVEDLLKESGLIESSVILPGWCPILQFTYQNVTCDLAINNKSAFQSTNLMRLCAKLDYRVPLLFAVISYWAKCQGFCGGVNKFKSYAVFLLLVHFLQTRNPPVLPPLSQVFDETGFLPDMVDRTFDIDSCVHKVHQTENCETAESLLQQFFFYYSHFDFSRVICTLDPAKVVTINPRTKQFTEWSETTSHHQFDKNFKANTISVRDPLHANLNVTMAVSFKYCKRFEAAVRAAREAYQEADFSVPSQKDWGLLVLFQNIASFKDSVLSDHSTLLAKQEKARTESDV